MQAVEIFAPVPHFLAGWDAAAAAFRSTRMEDDVMELSLFPCDVFAELDRLQRQMQQAFEFSRERRACSSSASRRPNTRPRRIDFKAA
jgi:hypothetical protein